MQKTTLIFGIVIVAIIGLVAWQTYQQNQRLHDLETRLTDKTALDNLTLAKMCAEQGAKVFHDPGNVVAKQDVINSYLTHYSSKRGKCFMLLQISDMSGIASSGSTSVYEGLTDAYDQTSYGEYDNSHDAKTITDHLMACKMSATGQDSDAKPCHSVEEWHSYTDGFLHS